VLAKIDVDAQPRLGALFQAQSIPMVVAIIKGQPLPLFNGAYPEPQVRQVIDEVLRVAAEQGVDGTVAAPDSPVEEAADEVAEVVDPRLDEAFAAIEEGDWDGAERAYKALLDSAPGDPEALAGLATVGVYRRTDGAHDPASPQTVDELLLAADFAALRGDWPVAFGRGIDAVRQASGPERDRARTRVLEYFAMAGDDPAVASARTALASALF
jgi:putative thioredoxin